jgi:hypothetical protein
MALQLCSDTAGITEYTGSHEVSCVSFISYGHYYEPELATSYEKARLNRTAKDSLPGEDE